MSLASDNNTAATTGEPSSMPKRIAFIDGLRALAVIAIILFHLFPDQFPNGYLGVDIFFVISGYVITKIILEDVSRYQFSFVLFYAKRVRRILPALIVVLFFVWTFAQTQLLVDEVIVLGKHLIAAALFVSNIFSWQESGYFGTTALAKPLLHLWSLAVEEQFYLLWPIVLVVLSKYSLQKIGVLVLSLLSLGGYLYFFDKSPDSVFFLLPFRGWELGIGCLIAINRMADSLFAPKALRLTNEQQSKIGLLLISLSFVAGDLCAYWCPKFTPSVTKLVPLLATIGTGFILIAGPRTPVSRIFSTPILQWIGLISYPLYLWHWPLLSLAKMTWPELKYSAVFVVCYLMLTMILATVTYALIERPLQNRLNFHNLNHDSLTKANLAIATGLFALFGLAALGLLTSRGYLLSQNQFAVLEIAKFRDYKFGSLKRPCFAELHELLSQREPVNCIAKASANHVFLWGDSISYHLAGAMEKLTAANGLNFSSLSSSRCPPLLDYQQADRENCGPNNEYIFSKIQELKPTSVLLMCNWVEYDQGEFTKHLKATIDKIRSAGVKKIFILGQLPYWSQALYRILELHVQQNGFPVPNYTSDGLDRRIFAVDQFLRDTINESHAKVSDANASADAIVIPLLDLVCRGNACQTTMTFENQSFLTTFDSAHPTEPMADIYAKRAIQILQQNLQ